MTHTLRLRFSLSLSLSLVALLLTQCTSAARERQRVPRHQWHHDNAGEMPDPGTVCPPRALPTRVVHGQICVEARHLVRERECAQRYNLQAWERSRNRARKRGLVPVELPTLEAWSVTNRGGTRLVANLRDRGDPGDRPAPWDARQGTFPLHPLTDEARTRLGATQVISLSRTGSYVARRGDTYLLVVPEYRERETRTVRLCQKCPDYGGGGMYRDPEPVRVTAAVLPTGVRWGGVIALPTYTMSLQEKRRTSWSQNKLRGCPPPMP